MEVVYRQKGGPHNVLLGEGQSRKEWAMGSMEFRGNGPPSTRKGYAAAVSGKAANGGRRAAAPTRCSTVRKAVYFFFSFGPCTARLSPA